MRDPRMVIAGWAWRARNRVAGVARYRDPLSYFGPGGLDEAEALCAEANRDLPAFLQPPAEAEVRGLRRERTGDRRDGVRIEDWSLDSPLPSGIASNDRIRFRLYLPAGSGSRNEIVMFHHPVYQRHWGLWSWFLQGLFRRVAVVVLVAPHHFERIEPGRFPGEGTVNPNPARLFEAIRQWCWDHEAVVRALRDRSGLRVAAEIGYSMGGYQMLMLASMGRIDVPLVTIAATNRYAYGLTHGIMGAELLRSMREVGINEAKLFEMTESIVLERFVHRLLGHRVLYIRGSHDFVDPAPSLDRLEQALRPTRAVNLRAGHANLILRRRRISSETVRFFGEVGVLDSAVASGS